MTDIMEVVVEDFTEPIEVTVEFDITEIIVETTEGLPGRDGVDGGSANGVVAIASTLWVLVTGLDFNPAGLKFFNDDGDEMEPESITYSSPGTVVVVWFVARSGTWTAS